MSDDIQWFTQQVGKIWQTIFLHMRLVRMIEIRAKNGKNHPRELKPTRHVVELAKIGVVFVGFPDDLQRCSPEVGDMFSIKTAPYQNNGILAQIHQGKEIDGIIRMYVVHVSCIGECTYPLLGLVSCISHGLFWNETFHMSPSPNGPQKFALLVSRTPHPFGHFGQRWRRPSSLPTCEQEQRGGPTYRDPQPWMKPGQICWAIFGACSSDVISKEKSWALLVNPVAGWWWNYIPLGCGSSKSWKVGRWIHVGLAFQDHRLKRVLGRGWVKSSYFTNYIRQKPWAMIGSWNELRIKLHDKRVCAHGITSLSMISFLIFPNFWNIWTRRGARPWRQFWETPRVTLARPCMWLPQHLQSTMPLQSLARQTLRKPSIHDLGYPGRGGVIGTLNQYWWAAGLEKDLGIRAYFAMNSFDLPFIPSTPVLK